MTAAIRFWGNSGDPTRTLDSLPPSLPFLWGAGRGSGREDGRGERVYRSSGEGGGGMDTKDHLIENISFKELQNLLR